MLFRSASVTAPLARNGLSASLNLQAMSQRLALNGAVAPAYTVANVTVTAPHFSRRVEMSAAIWNLFDNRYGDPGSEEHRQTLIPQDGRVVGVQVRVRF